MPESRPPSMADVASAAGVSHQTVSRVVNGHAYVRAETRDRVLQTIEALGYRRNQAARTLVTSRSATIGIVSTDTTSHGPASTALAIERAARSEGYFVSIAALTSREPGSARAVLEQLMSQGVDGIIVVAPLVEVARLVDDISPRVPVVVVAARADAPAASSVRYVAVDQRSGSADATRHLLALGHTGIAHVTGPTDWYDAIERSRGFAEAMPAPVRDLRILHADDWGAASGHAAGEKLAPDVRRGAVTAVVAGNDHLAIGVSRALADRGLRVPGDVSIVGFDDIEAGGFLLPSLTTVSQPFEALGEAALRTLLEPSTSEPLLIPPALVVRESTAPPPVPR